MASNRKIIFANGEIYHTLNRSIAHEEIFVKEMALKRILELANFYRYRQSLKYSSFKRLSSFFKQKYILETSQENPLVEIYGFAFMPNHFHFLLKQISDNGIGSFMSNIQNGFAKYFNLRENRDGSLFKRPFRAKHVENISVFLHVLRYIHLNPVTSFLIKFSNLSAYRFNSFSHYVDPNHNTFIEKGVALSHFPTVDSFITFTANQEDYQKALRSIKDQLLE